MRVNQYILLFGMAALAACSKNPITPPLQNPSKNLVGTVEIADTVMKHMEGIYALSSGSDAVGSEFVCKVSKYKVSFFSNRGGIYIILAYGLNPVDSSIQFAGFWRYSESATQGLINLSIAHADGAADILAGNLITQIKLTGGFGGENANQNPVTIHYGRAFSAYATSHPFMIFAHHGVQTNTDPPYTENSLNGAIHDEDYGVNGLEFDVHLTKDHVPICAHDANVNIRVTEKGPLSGNYIQYDFAFLDSFVRLTDGERIPSVQQVLDAFVDSTTLQFMWLDVKGDPDIFKYLEPVVREAYARAALAGRNVVIFADLPSEAVIEDYQAWPPYHDLPTMCEVSLDDVLSNNCQYWGPRYTLGLLLNEVDQAHSDGIKVCSWTLNDKNLIYNYMVNGRFDGFISDYPAYVVYDYYTLF